jgi:hypothetical protein
MNTATDDRRDRGSAIIAAAILGAALILSWGMSKSEPRYQLASSEDAVIRMDTDSGEMIACNAQRCSRVQPPDRAKTFGPLTVEIGGSEEQAKPPAPTN